MNPSLLSVTIGSERDVVLARQRARQIAAGVGFDAQDQTRISTAVSEIARNAFAYAGGGVVEFHLEGTTPPQLLLISVRDEGPGIADVAHVLSGQYRSATGMGVGLIGARRLMDQFAIASVPGRGTTVTLKKLLPARAPLVGAQTLARIEAELGRQGPRDVVEEIQRQNQELMQALAELTRRQQELAALNRELEDTNRGVVALYAELDEKADHLRRADEMKTRFLSNMSHEFRTPLYSIRAFTRLLLERADGPLLPEQETQLNFIRKSAEDLSELVDDLLDLAKIEAGKVEVKPVEFSIENLFSALRGMLRPLLVSEKVKLVIDPPSGIPPLYTDEQKVSQILRNFISNGIKFTSAGEVRVTAELEPDGRQVRLRVADTGIGIAPEYQERIFEEFVQVPGPAQAGFKGTGLGLPLCRKLVGLLGGTLSLESHPGIGSTFTAAIPLQYAPVDENPALPPPEPSDGTIKVPVLVVEDELETQMLYAKLLRDTPYRVIGARNLRQAREALQRDRPAAIVLDIVLQGEDTWAWLGALKNDVRTEGIPIIVATTVPDQRKGLALGANVYLEKPVERRALLDHLNRLTAGRVLVIDDDEAIRYALRKYIEPTSYCLIEAGTARDGLRAAVDLKPRAILLDLRLPDMGGEQVLERLRSDAATSAIPVVVVTSQALSPDERQLLERTAVAVLSKRDLDGPAVGRMLARTMVQS